MYSRNSGYKLKRTLKRATPCAPIIPLVISPHGPPVVPAHATVPNSDATPAVTAMASAPQNVTHIAPIVTPAPPARAANPPSRARNNSEVPETREIKPAAGARAATNRGMAAPNAKLPADANGARIGRAGKG